MTCFPLFKIFLRRVSQFTTFQGSFCPNSTWWWGGVSALRATWLFANTLWYLHLSWPLTYSWYVLGSPPPWWTPQRVPFLSAVSEIPGSSSDWWSYDSLSSCSSSLSCCDSCSGSMAACSWADTCNKRMENKAGKAGSV